MPNRSRSFWDFEPENQFSKLCFDSHERKQILFIQENLTRYARKREKLAIMSVLPDPGSKHAEAAA